MIIRFIETINAARSIKEHEAAGCRHVIQQRSFTEGEAFTGFKDLKLPNSG